MQTPQAFRAAPAARRRTGGRPRDGFVGTDTASCIERYTDLPVRCVPGDAGNIKITFPEDLFLAERLLAKARLGPLRRARAARAAGPTSATSADGPATMTDVEHAELRCETCDRGHRARAALRRPAAGVDALHGLRHAPRAAPRASLLPAYLADLEQRVVSKPRRMVRRAGARPARLRAPAAAGDRPAAGQVPARAPAICCADRGQADSRTHPAPELVDALQQVDGAEASSTRRRQRRARTSSTGAARPQPARPSRRSRARAAARRRARPAAAGPAPAR